VAEGSGSRLLAVDAAGLAHDGSEICPAMTAGESDYCYPYLSINGVRKKRSRRKTRSDWPATLHGGMSLWRQIKSQLG